MKVQKVQLKEVLFLELKNVRKKKKKIILSIVLPFESIQSPSGSVLTVFASNSLSKKSIIIKSKERDFWQARVGHGVMVLRWKKVGLG